MGRRTRPPLPACFCFRGNGGLISGQTVPVNGSAEYYQRTACCGCPGQQIRQQRSDECQPVGTTTEMVARLSTRREPRWRVPVGEVRRSCDAPCRLWLHHHYVIGCRSAGIGRISWLLRHKGRRTAVREGSRDGVRGRSRWDTGQHRPSRGHRHADLDEATGIGREQCGD